MQRTCLGLVFYVDQNLDSNKFVKPLKALGVHVERHRDHFASNEADVRWIPYTAQKGWVAMTTDKKIKLSEAERQAIIQAQARMLFLHQKQDLPIEKLAANFVKTFPEIRQFFEGCVAPCLASLRRPSDPRVKGPGTVYEIRLK